MDQIKEIFNEQDKNQFQTWSDEMKDNIRSLFDLSHNNPELANLRMYKEYDKKAAWAKIEQRIHRGKSYTFPFLKVAAAVAILVIGFFGFQQFFQTPASEAITVVATQNQNVELPDGSIVFLNSNSFLTYQPRGFVKDRKVSFSGKGRFDVVKSSDSEFVVQSESLSVRVLGTTFEINTIAEKPKVIVTEGKVAIQTPNDEKEILAGEIAYYFDDEINIEKLEHIVQYHWLQEPMKYQNEKVEDVFRELGGHFGVEIELNPKSNDLNCLLNTEFYNETLLEILEEFKSIFGAEYKFQNEKLFISGLYCN